MKNNINILLCFIIFIYGCNNRINPSGSNQTEQKGANNVNSKIEKHKSDKNSSDASINSMKVSSTDFDINSQSFIDEYTNENGRGFRGIEPGMTFADVKKRLGSPTKYSIEEMPDFGGYRVYFNNFILVFEDVKKKIDLKNDSKLKYVFLRNPNAVNIEDFESVWGDSETFIPFNHGSIGTNIYKVNGKEINSFFSHGVIEFVSKENFKKISEESKRTYQGSNDTLTEVDGVSHYNFPDILSSEFASSIIDNTFSVKRIGVLKHFNFDPDSILKKNVSESMEGHTKYDNFSIVWKDGSGDENATPVARMYLDVSDQNININDLIENWDISNKIVNEDSNKKIFRSDAGTDYEILFDNDDIVQEIIIGEKDFYKSQVIQDNHASDYTSYDFGYEVLSNSYSYKGIHAGDDYDMDEVIEIAGEPEDSVQGYLIYSNDHINIDTHSGFVRSLSIDLEDSDVLLKDLKAGWAKDFEDVDTEHGLETIYDGNKTNGYYISVRSDGGYVKRIAIYGVNRGE